MSSNISTSASASASASVSASVIMTDNEYNKIKQTIIALSELVRNYELSKAKAPISAHITAPISAPITAPISAPITASISAPIAIPASIAAPIAIPAPIMTSVWAPIMASVMTHTSSPIKNRPTMARKKWMTMNMPNDRVMSASMVISEVYEELDEYDSLSRLKIKNMSSDESEYFAFLCERYNFNNKLVSFWEDIQKYDILEESDDLSETSLQILASLREQHEFNIKVVLAYSNIQEYECLTMLDNLSSDDRLYKRFAFLAEKYEYNKKLLLKI